MRNTRVRRLRSQCIRAWEADSGSLKTTFRSLQSFCRSARRAWKALPHPQRSRLSAAGE